MLVRLSMAAGHGLPAAVHEIERRLSSLKALCVHLEQEEALADSAAFRAEQKLLRLGRQNKNETWTSLRRGSGWILSHRAAPLDCAWIRAVWRMLG